MDKYKDIEAKEIEALVDRFLGGETTNAEERKLYAFFAGGDIPEPLQKYRALFAWFDAGIRAEAPIEAPLPRPGRRLGLWAAGAAAALVAALWLLRPATPTGAETYEESYIVRGGVKITDPAIVRPAIAATLRFVADEERTEEQLLYEAGIDDLFELLDEWERQKNEFEY